MTNVRHISEKRPVKNTELTSWSPSIVIIGLTSMPGVFISTKRNDIPSCFFPVNEHVWYEERNCFGGILYDAITTQPYFVDERNRILFTINFHRLEGMDDGKS